MYLLPNILKYVFCKYYGDMVIVFCIDTDEKYKRKAKDKLIIHAGARWASNSLFIIHTCN